MSAIAHAGLTVADLDRSLAFWRDAMGMVEVVSQEKQGGYLEAIVCEPGAHVRMVHLEFPGGGPRIELALMRGRTRSDAVPAHGRTYAILTAPAAVWFSNIR